MRIRSIAALTLLSGSVVFAQQSEVEYVIAARVFAANPPDIGSVRIVAAPTFRVRASNAAVADLSSREGSDGVRMTLKPSDIGSGKVALGVEIEVRRSGQTATSRFDLLTGSQTQTATVALRSVDGTFIVDRDGRPLFATFETTRVVR